MDGDRFQNKKKGESLQCTTAAEKVSRKELERASMAAVEGDRFAFEVEWLDHNVGTKRKYQLMYYTANGTIEMVRGVPWERNQYFSVKK